MAIVSPSHPRPAVIQRMSISEIDCGGCELPPRTVVVSATRFLLRQTGNRNQLSAGIRFKRIFYRIPAEAILILRMGPTRPRTPLWKREVRQSRAKPKRDKHATVKTFLKQSHGTNLEIPQGILKRHDKYISRKNQARCSQYISHHPKCAHHAPF